MPSPSSGRPVVTAEDRARFYGALYRAQFDLDIGGFGPLTAFARLGLIDDRLEGPLYIRTDYGEFTFPRCCRGCERALCSS